MKEYFSLTSRERNGFFALIVLLFLLLFLMHYWQMHYSPEIIDLSTLEDSVDAFYASPRFEETHRTYNKYDVGLSEQKIDSTINQKAYVSFPKKRDTVIVEINGASAEELQQIRGIGKVYAKNIIAMRQTFGGFTSFDQLLCVYGMTDEKLAQLKPFMRIDTRLLAPKILLNTADTTQLSQIPAIDPYCAKRIVTYRERLGGFYDPDQLLEVYGIDETNYHEMMNRLTLDTVELQLLDINNIEFKALMKHPYIDGYENTKAIFRYLQYGDITTWKEFCKIPHLNITALDRLKHYVKFEPRQPKLNTEDSLLLQEAVKDSQ